MQNYLPSRKAYVQTVKFVCMSTDLHRRYACFLPAGEGRQHHRSQTIDSRDSTIYGQNISPPVAGSVGPAPPPLYSAFFYLG